MQLPPQGNQPLNQQMAMGKIPAAALRQLLALMQQMRGQPQQGGFAPAQSGLQQFRISPPATSISAQSRNPLRLSQGSVR